MERALECLALLAYNARDLDRAFTQGPDFIPPGQRINAASGGELCDVPLQPPDPAGDAAREQHRHGYTSRNSQEDAHSQDGILLEAQLIGAGEVSFHGPCVTGFDALENALYLRSLGFGRAQGRCKLPPWPCVGLEAGRITENTPHARAFQRGDPGQALLLKRI